MELPITPGSWEFKFHPEFRSRPVKPHPLFCGFMGAAVKMSETNARRKRMKKIIIGILIGALLLHFRGPRPGCGGVIHLHHGKVERLL
ncbi:hypothetical protein MASR1M66_02080 [Aminivibrio sp.]